MSLAEASQHLKSLGRGEDTELVHMTPLEVQWLSQMQGGMVINPRTGLPEFGLLGKILKGVVRAAGAIGGFMVGGPAGAAVGAGLGTKLTGGSWGDALKSGALSGLGSFAAQGLTGGGWNLTGGASGAGAGAASAAGTGGLTAAEAGGIPGLAGYGAAQAAPSIGSQFLSAAMLPGGAAAGLSAFGSRDAAKYDDTPIPELPKDTFELKRANPFNRALQKYQGDYATYGMGPGFQFFDEVNPAPTYLRQGGRVQRYAYGGPVTMTPGMPQLPGTSMPMQNMQPQMPMLTQTPMMARTGPGGVGMMQAGSVGAMPMAAQGIDPYAQLSRDGVMRVAAGGGIRGAGDGTSDDVPAMLSDGEHVIDSATVSLAGRGSNDAGHRVIEQIKTQIRNGAGMKKPKIPPRAVKGIGSMVTRAMRRSA